MRSDAIIIFGVTLAILLAMTFSTPAHTSVGRAGSVEKNSVVSSSAETDASDTVLEGTVSLMAADDFERGTSRTYYTLQTKDGMIELKDVQLGELKPGAKYRILGTADGKTFSAKPGGMTLLDDPGMPGPEWNLGENKLLVILGEYGDAPLEHTREEA